MTDALEQAQYDLLRSQLEREGLDLSEHGFPNKHPVTGSPL